MPSFSALTFGIFVAGYITARWDLVNRFYELSIFAWDHGVVVCRHHIMGYSHIPPTKHVVDANSKRLRPSLCHFLPVHYTICSNSIVGSKLGMDIRWLLHLGIKLTNMLSTLDPLKAVCLQESS